MITVGAHGKFKICPWILEFPPTVAESPVPGQRFKVLWKCTSFWLTARLSKAIVKWPSSTCSSFLSVFPSSIFLHLDGLSQYAHWAWWTHGKRNALKLNILMIIKSDCHLMKTTAVKTVLCWVALCWSVPHSFFNLRGFKHFRQTQ